MCSQVCIFATGRQNNAKSPKESTFLHLSYILVMAKSGDKSRKVGFTGVLRLQKVPLGVLSGDVQSEKASLKGF